MRIFGIDPGYATVGWGVVDCNGNRFSVIDYGAIFTEAKLPFEIRLEHIYDDVISIIERYQPTVLAIEKLYFNTNAKTAIAVSQARGVMLLAAVKKGLEIFEYTPLQVKQSVVGYGRAEKLQVQKMTQMILNLPQIPKPDDTADALALTICHGHTGGSSLAQIYKKSLK